MKILKMFIIYILLTECCYAFTNREYEIRHYPNSFEISINNKQTGEYLSEKNTAKIVHKQILLPRIKQQQYGPDLDWLFFAYPLSSKHKQAYYASRNEISVQTLWYWFSTNKAFSINQQTYKQLTQKQLDKILTEVNADIKTLHLNTNKDFLRFVEASFREIEHVNPALSVQKHIQRLHNNN